MTRLPYSLEYVKDFRKDLHKLADKNPQFQKAVENKLKQVLEDPHRFKPLGNQMHGLRRVHIMKSFVLIYEILEGEKIVKLVKIDHHDNAYKI